MHCHSKPHVFSLLKHTSPFGVHLIEYCCECFRLDPCLPSLREMNTAKRRTFCPGNICLHFSKGFNFPKNIIK